MTVRIASAGAGFDRQVLDLNEISVRFSQARDLQLPRRSGAEARADEMQAVVDALSLLPHRDGLEPPADAGGARPPNSPAPDRALRADRAHRIDTAGGHQSTRGVRGGSASPSSGHTEQLLPSKRQRKQVPVPEIDHATTPSALDQQTNRNSRRDKRLRAPSQRTPRQSSLSGQDRTVTFGTENKGSPSR